MHRIYKLDSYTAMGDLQKVLDKGEYISLKNARVFESKFVQGRVNTASKFLQVKEASRFLLNEVTRRGESVYLHNRPNYVTMGICASRPNLSMPNVMLLAHSTPSSSQEDISRLPSRTKLSSSEDELILTRFLPLKFVDISVHSVRKRRIKLKLVSGRSYYLELCAPPEKQAFLFHQWTRLIGLLRSQHKRAPVNVLYKDFDTQEASTDARNKILQGDCIEALISQQSSEEPVKTEIIKKASSKRVTISDIVGPIEEFRKSRSQATVSAYSCMKRSSTDLENQNIHRQELMNRTPSKTRSREQQIFYHTDKRLQTSGILKNVSKSGVVFYN